MTTLPAKISDHLWSPAELAKARAIVRKGPPAVRVSVMPTGPDEYTRTIQRIGDAEPLAIQAIRGPDIEAGVYVLEGAAAERVLERARKSGDCLDILDADFDGE